MKTVTVITKRKGQRNTKTIATCDPRNGTSVSHVMDRPNVKRSLRTSAASLARS
jgi:hypothetical protein